MLNRILTVLACVLAGSVAAETALRDDGRKVELKADGSWAFISDDVYATTETGQRVILKADGSWSTVALPKTDIAFVNTAVKSVEDSFLAIDHIVVEKAIHERRAFSKNKVYQYQTIIELTFLKGLSKTTVELSDIGVSDDKGNAYPVLSIKPLADNQIRLIAKGAPDRWTRAKQFVVTVHKSLSNTQNDLRYEYDARLADTETVQELSQ